MPRSCFGAEVLGGDLAQRPMGARDRAGAALSARPVVNCAGLFGDVVEQRLLGGAAFTIRPRKGQFVVFDKAAAPLLRTIVLPVPTERTKGVVLARTVFGNLLVGPTAEEQEDRERATVDAASLDELIAKAVAMLPALAGMPVTATYAGLRPATEHKDVPRPARCRSGNWLTVGGIRSTGLTAALGPGAARGDLSRRPGAMSTSVAGSGLAAHAQSGRASATRLGDTGPWRDRLPLRAGDAGARSRRRWPGHCPHAISAA